MKTDSVLRFLAAVTCLLLTAGSRTVSAAEGVPSVSKNEWIVGIAMLQTDEDAGPVTVSTASLIPRLILDGLSGVEDHRLTEEERRYLASAGLKEDLRLLNISLAKQYAERDRMFFDPNASASVIEDRDRAIRESNAELDRLERFPVSEVIVPESMALVITQGSDGAEFLDPLTVDADAYLQNSDLDALIHGSIVRVGDYFGLKLLISTLTNDHVIWEGAVGENGLQDAADEAARVARGLLLGRPWSAVTIRVLPPEATISIDGEVVGVGLWSSTVLYPGSAFLEVTAPGYVPRARDLELTANGSTDLDIELETGDTPSILVTSNPTGAEVRLGSLWLGRTPLAIELPDRVMSLTLEKEGFRSETVPFYPDAERLSVSLEASVLDPAQELAVSRKKLHTSIALFSFSLAPVVILLGVSQNYANMYINSSTAADQDYAYNAYNLTYGLMWGSVGVSALLLTNVFFKLARYLKAAEELKQ